MNDQSFRIALGPLLYYWSRQETLDFYLGVASSPVDVVYLGETVCSRRHELRHDDWLGLAAMMTEAGKQVVLSTRVLIETSAEVTSMYRLCEQPTYLVEAGEVGAIGAIGAVHRAKNPGVDTPRGFVAGPHMNAYNGETLRWLQNQGAVRCVVPLEMDQKALYQLIAEKPAGLELEMMVWGRMPLAFSARCFTARHFRLNKDSCGFRCNEHPDGLELRTRESQQFLAINGIQTQSAACLDLLDEAERIADMGVDVLRVSPQSQGTLDAIRALDAVRRGRPAYAVSPPEGINRCNGYWHGRPGIDLCKVNQ
jgi:collagenase-like PrtC family protease